MYLVKHSKERIKFEEVRYREHAIVRIEHQLLRDKSRFKSFSERCEVAVTAKVLGHLAMQGW